MFCDEAAGSDDAVDTKVPGVRVRVTPTGAKSFSYLYRIKGERKKRRITLGAVGKLDLAGARELAKEHAVTAVRGIDPAAAIRDRRAAERAVQDEKTVEELGVLYLAHMKVSDATTTHSNRESRWRRFVLPAFGAMVPRRIERKDVAALHRSLLAHPPLANRVVELVSAFYGWCADQGLVPDGTAPTNRLKKYEESSRERFLTSDELGRLVRAIDTAETIGLPAAPSRQRAEPDPKYAKHAAPPASNKKHRARGSIAPANPYAIACLRLLLLSGWREREVLSLRWDAVDLERRIATLATTKTGKSQRMLSAASIALLAALPRHAGSPWCFPSPVNPKRHLSDLGRLWDAVRFAAKLNGFRLHDLRHSAASFAIGAGASLAVVGKMLGHKNSATTARYAHLADDPVRAATELVAAAVAGASLVQATPVLMLHSTGGNDTAEQPQRKAR